MPEESTGAAMEATDSTTTDSGQSETDVIDWKAEATKAQADVEKWKALSRKNEDAAKSAAKEIEKAAKAGMSEAEKAVADAELRGRQAAAKDYGVKLAAAEFKAAVAAKGLDLGDALELIDTSKFVNDDGDVDDAAIKAAVAKVAKFAGPNAGRSGGEFAGGTGAGTPITEEQMRKMSPDERVKALEAGLLKHLM